MKLADASSSSPKVAVVTGSNKGIGFATAKALLQHSFDGHVYLTARDVCRGQAAVQELEKVSFRRRMQPVSDQQLTRQVIQFFSAVP